MQVLLWACTLFFLVPQSWAQEDTKVVTGKYTVGTTETPFTGKPSLEKALEGVTLAQITAIEVTAGVICRVMLRTLRV